MNIMMKTEIGGYSIVELRQEIMKIFLCHADPDDMNVAIMELLACDLMDARLAEQMANEKQRLVGGDS